MNQNAAGMVQAVSLPELGLRRPDDSCIKTRTGGKRRQQYKDSPSLLFCHGIPSSE
jgi:hypothetical protein